MLLIVCPTLDRSLHLELTVSLRESGFLESDFGACSLDYAVHAIPSSAVFSSFGWEEWDGRCYLAARRASSTAHPGSSVPLFVCLQPFKQPDGSDLGPTATDSYSEAGTYSVRGPDYPKTGVRI